MDVRKIFRWIHRELGYFFATMAIIYGISGIALNHRGDWNPDMVVTRKTETLPDSFAITNFNQSEAEAILKLIDEADTYKKHYSPTDSTIKIFFNVSGGNGSVEINLNSRQLLIEKLERRFFFYPINRMHRNSFRQLWTWFSDLFALSMIIFAITGIFMMKGKYGLSKHGIYWVIAGTLIPIALYFIYTL